MLTTISLEFPTAEAVNFAAGALSIVSVALRFCVDRGLVPVAGEMTTSLKISTAAPAVETLSRVSEALRFCVTCVLVTAVGKRIEDEFDIID